MVSPDGNATSACLYISRFPFIKEKTEKLMLGGRDTLLYVTFRYSEARLVSPDKLMSLMFLLDELVISTSALSGSPW